MNNPAMESIFANPEQTAQSLIDAATLGIDTKVTTIDEAEKLVDTLSKEAAKFNDCLLSIANAMRQVESGDMTKDEAASIIAPCVKELKTNCTALKISNAETPGDDICENEIAILREVIIGTKAAAEARVEVLRTTPVDETASESTIYGGIMESLNNMGVGNSPALEANLASEMLKSTEAKTAKELYKSAKKLYSVGSKEKAKEYLKKAQSLYEKCLDKVMKSGKFKNVTRTTSITDSSKTKSMSDQEKRNVTEDMSFARAAAYFEDRIDSCKALMLQWENKAGKATFKETKATLKAERKAEKQRIKDEKKAAKAKTPAAESAINNLDFSGTMEGIISEKQNLKIDPSDDIATEGLISWVKGRAKKAKFKREFKKATRAKVNELIDDTFAKEGVDATAAKMVDFIKENAIRKPDTSDAAKAFLESDLSNWPKAGDRNYDKSCDAKVTVISGVPVMIITDKTDFAELMIFYVCVGRKPDAKINVGADTEIFSVVDYAKAMAEKELKETMVMESNTESVKDLISACEAVLAALESNDDCDDDDCDDEDEDEDSELEELATEAAIAVMLAEDGFDLDDEI